MRSFLVALVCGSLFVGGCGAWMRAAGYDRSDQSSRAQTISAGDHAQIVLADDGWGLGGEVPWRDLGTSLLAIFGLTGVYEAHRGKKALQTVVDNVEARKKEGDIRAYEISARVAEETWNKKRGKKTAAGRLIHRAAQKAASRV